MSAVGGDRTTGAGLSAPGRDRVRTERAGRLTLPVEVFASPGARVVGRDGWGTRRPNGSPRLGFVRVGRRTAVLLGDI